MFPYLLVGTIWPASDPSGEFFSPAFPLVQHYTLGVAAEDSFAFILIFS